MAELLRLNALSDEEESLYRQLNEQLSSLHYVNKDQQRYYEGDTRQVNSSRSIPPHMRSRIISNGWAAKIVDVLEARLDFNGWASPNEANPHGLADVYRDNHLSTDSSLVHLDSLIFGVGFVVVGTGMEGEADPLITVESPLTFTGKWNARTRRLAAALSSTDDYVTLYLPEQTVYMETDASKRLVVVDRDLHNLGTVPVAVFANKRTPSRWFGRSEITKPIRTKSDEAMAVAQHMAVTSELFSSPARFLLGADMEAFTDEAGNPLPVWDLYLDKLLAVSADQDGSTPSVQQMPQASPEPYIAVLNHLAKEVAAEAGIPIRYLDNNRNAPTSADAIRADEAELIKKAERKQEQFGLSWREVARIALLVRDGALPDDFNEVQPLWGSAATPTRAGAADEVTKLVGANILPADSDVVLERLDLSPLDKARIRATRTTNPISDDAETKRN